MVCENFSCGSGASFSSASDLNSVEQRGFLDWSEWDRGTYSTGNSETEWLIELGTVGKSGLLTVYIYVCSGTEWLFALVVVRQSGLFDWL